MDYATKMLDWGDKVVGFQHARDVQGWIQPVSCVRFYLQQPDRVEVHFSTTIAYGGGVQHSAEGSVVLRREHAAELGAMLEPPSAKQERLRAPADEFDHLAGRGMHELRIDELPAYLAAVAWNHGARSEEFAQAAQWVASELERKTNDERVIAVKLAELRDAD